MPGKKSFKFPSLELGLGGLLLSLWGCLHWRVLFQGQTFILGDASSVFYPLWKWGSETLGKGLFPLWCPEVAMGTPYEADPTNAAWYPFKMLPYLLFDPTTAFNAMLLGHSLWILAGFWFLARQRGFSTWGAFGGSLILGFSSNSLLLFWSPAMALAFSWTPWVLASFDRFWKGEREGWLFFCTAIALQWSAGYPLIGYLSVFLLGLDLLARTTLKPGFFPLRKSFLFLAALGFAALFNAAWILPLAEYAPLSSLSLRGQMASAVAWGDWATWLNPFFLGHPLHTPRPDFPFRVYFMGLPTLVLFLHGLLTRRISRRSGWLWAAVAVFSLGETAGLGGWLKSIAPGYHWVVRSGYWMPFVVLMTALACLEALESFRNEKETRRADVLGMGLALGTYLAALAVGVPGVLLSFWLSLGLLLAFFYGGFHSTTRTAFLCGSLFFSLGPVDQALHFTMDRSFYDSPPPLARLLTKPGRLYQAPDWVDAHLATSGNGVADACLRVKNSLPPNWPLAFGVWQAGYENTLFLKSFLDWYALPQRTKPQTSLKILDFLGARYVMGVPEPPGAGKVGTETWENPEALPFWFSVQKAEGWNSWNPDNSKFDFGAESLVGDPELEGTYLTRKVSEEFRTPNEIRISARGHGRALLVSSEMAYPGWQAKVGGAFRPLETVNGCFRGLVLNEDETEAEVVYRPVTFRLGCFLSFLACGLWAAMATRKLLSRERF